MFGWIPDVSCQSAVLHQTHQGSVQENHTVKLKIFWVSSTCDNSSPGVNTGFSLASSGCRVMCEFDSAVLPDSRLNKMNKHISLSRAIRCPYRGGASPNQQKKHIQPELSISLPASDGGNFANKWSGLNCFQSSWEWVPKEKIIDFKEMY